MSGESLRVDPVEVLMAADHVDAAAEGLRTEHGSAQNRLGAAGAGWIGSSAAALTHVAAKWEQESAHHYSALVGHVEALRSTAVQYTQTDSHEAAAIDTAVSPLGSMGL